MTQNQLIELFETDQLKAIVERSEERGWVDAAELASFVTEQELGSEEIEQVTRELEAMGLEVGAPAPTEEEEKAKEAAEAAVWASEALSGAADSLQLFLADVGRHKLLNAAQEVQLAKRIERGDPVAKRHMSTLTLGRLRSTGLIVSFRPSPSSVRPVTRRTIASPGNSPVHQIPEAASDTARLMS